MTCPRCNKSIPDDALICCYCARTIVRRPAPHMHQRGNGSGYAYKRGKTYTAVITVGWRMDENGKRHQIRMTKGGFKTKNEALAHTAVMGDRGRHNAKKAPSLSEYWEAYKSGEYEKLSDSKQTAYRIAWQKLKPIHHVAVDLLTVADLRSVVNASAQTYYPARDMQTVLKHLFRLAGAEGWANKDLPSFIVLPDLHEKERSPFTSEEQESLWRLYETGDARAALPLIMIYTGMMPGEMQELKTEMIDLEARQIIGVGLKTKVRRASPVYLPEVIVPVLYDEMLSSSSKAGYVWPRNEKRFYERYYEALAAAGCRRLEPYSCRHTTATALSITENIAPQTIKKVMRWSTTKMLDRYSHPDDADAIAAVNKLKRPSSK